MRSLSQNASHMFQVKLPVNFTLPPVLKILHYKTINPLKYNRRRLFKTFWGKEKMLVTIKFYDHIYFDILECSEFGQV